MRRRFVLHAFYGLVAGPDGYRGRTPPTSPPASKRPSCASPVMAKAVFRGPRTFPRSPASPTSSFSGNWCSFAPAPARTTQMQPIIEQLDNDDIRNLGAYFASLPPPRPKPDDNPDLSRKGAQAAAGRRCASCHTDNYAGTKAIARVAGQRQEYLVEGAARLQVRRAIRRRHGGDGECRLFPQRGGNRGAGALSRAFVSSGE